MARQPGDQMTFSPPFDWTPEKSALLAEQLITLPGHPCLTAIRVRESAKR